MNVRFLKNPAFVFVLGLLIVGLTSGTSATTIPGTLNLSFSPTGAGAGFMPNAGHLSNPAVRFHGKLPDSALFLTDQQITYALFDVQTGNSEGAGSERGWVLRERPMWNRDFAVKGHDPLSTGLSVFKGPVEAWRIRVPVYRRLSLGEVAEGVQMILTLGDDRLEKIFKVDPGADPSAISFEVEGAKCLQVNAGGELEILTGLRTIRWSRPVAYQWIDGRKKTVKVAYAVSGNHYGFTTGSFNREFPLVIDPILACAGLGGDSRDVAFDVVVAPGGDVYVTGMTKSADFPTTTGAYVSVNRGDEDIFVARLDRDLTTLKAAAIVGGSSNDGRWFNDSRGPAATGLALDASGNVFLGFATYSNNCPVLDDSWDKHISGDWDGYICKLNADLTSLLGATYFGGGGLEWIYDLAIDAQGQLFAAGLTTSGNMPTTEGAYDRTYNEAAHWYSSGDAFAAKFNNDLTSLLAGTYLGGGDYDYAIAMALDISGNVHLTGYTKSTGTSYTPFPTTPGAFQTELTGSPGKGFVSVLDNALATLSASTYLGPDDHFSQPLDIALGPMGTIAVTGRTGSGHFPVTLGAYQMSWKGSSDGFITILKPDLTGLEASTYLGGSYEDIAYTLGFDTGGNVWVGGQTWSYNFPTMFADNSDYGRGDGDAFISRFSPDLQQLKYSSFLGGSSFEGIYALAVDSGDEIVTAGLTYSADFPYTAGAYQSEDGGGTAFVARIEPPKILAVDIKGPSGVIPGEEVSFTVFFQNDMDVKAESVVVLVDVPDGLEYVSSTDQGTLCTGCSWAGPQIFWVIGDLESGEQGRVAFTCRAPWGATIGDTTPFFASIGARNFPATDFDLDFYLSYVPVSINSWSSVSDTGLTTLLSGDAGLNDLYQYAMGQGYFCSGKGAQANLSTDQTLKQVILFAPGTGDPTILNSIGGSIFAQVLKESRLIVFNQEGGFMWNADEDVIEPWEASASSLPSEMTPEDGLYRFLTSSSGAKTAPAASCVFNCMLKSVPEIIIKGASPLATALKIYYECGVASYQIKEGKTSAETVVYMGQCALDIIGAMFGPVASVAIDSATSLGICLGECAANPNLHACPENDTKVYCCPKKITYPMGCHDAVCAMECRLGRWYGPRVIAKPAFADYSWVCHNGVLVKKDQLDLFKKRGVTLKEFGIREGAHDPNAKSASPVGQVLAGQTIDYTVEYENVGQGTAYAVFIWDVLDEDLDASTLVINDGGTYVNNVRLIAWQVGDLPPCTAEAPDVCKGQVTFNVKTKAGLAAGTEIINQAEVHFPSADEITPTNATVHRVGAVTATPQTVEVVSGKPVSITLAGRAPGGAAVTYAVTNGPPFGTLSGTAPRYTYTSDPQFNGQDAFYFTAKSGGKTSSPAKVTINVAPDPADRTAPTVVETSPEAGDLNVHAEATAYSADPAHYRPTISAIFPEPMDPATISSTTFTVSGLAGDVFYDIQSRKAVFLPKTALSNTTTYEARVTTGAKDLAGNGLAGDYVWTFTTDGPDKLISVSANPATGGTVTGAGTYTEGESVTVIATANPGWIFVNWTEDGVVVSTTASYSFAAQKNRTLVANFKELNYYVNTTSGCDGKSPCYSRIQEAINAALSGATIKIAQGTYVEDLILTAPKDLTLSGGWDFEFTNQSSYTTVNSITISNGTITADKLKLFKPEASKFTATTGAATAITSDSATLNGAVNPNAGLTTVIFEYGTTTIYGSQVTATQSPLTGITEQEVSAGVTGLQPNTTYHFRVKATNSAGTTYGDDSLFIFIALPVLAPGGLPDTGQTQSYTSTFGEDADYLINPPSYTKLDIEGNDLPDSVTEWVMVRDNVTGLIWEVKTDDGSIHDKDNEYTWQNAQDVFVAELNSTSFGGHSDWRMPTIKELTFITDLSCYEPAINTTYFPHTRSSSYWSSTTNAIYTDYAWYVYFYGGYGDVSYKSSSYYVRAVRGGQTGSLDHLVINGDETVTDTATGLMWQQATDVGMNWEVAISHCEALSLAGYNDWRLPNRRELRSLVEYSRYDPAIDRDIFPDTLSFDYWSSTTYAYTTDDAWDVYFYSGNDYYNYKSYSYYVRAVRGGQARLLDNLVIYAPGQGSCWDVGDSMTITWDTKGISGNVKISISHQGGKESTFETIAASTENDGEYNWLVTGPGSVNSMLKIEPLSDPEKGTVQGLFSIAD